MTRHITLEIPAPCGWINSNQRLHRMQTAKLTKQWREAGMVAAQGLEPFVGPVHITAHIWKKRGGRYDAGNLYPTVKGLVDGLVDSGLLVDDSNEYVLGPDMRHGGVGNPEIVLEISEIGEGE